MQNNLKRAMDTGLRTLRTTEGEQAQILRFCLDGRKVKHKLSAAFVTALILILLAATALAVTAVTGHLRFMQPEDGPQALSYTVLDGTLYMFTNDGLMEWTPADDGPAKLLDWQSMDRQGIPIDSLLFHTDTLMLLDAENEVIWQYDKGRFTKSLTLHGLSVQFGQNSLGNPVAAGEFLFIRAAGGEDAGYEAVTWRISLSTGWAEALDIPGLIELASYRDGQLLAVRQDLANETVSLLIIDAASGRIVRELAVAQPLEIEGIAYSEERDAILAIHNGSLSQWNGSQWEALQTASIPAHSYFYGAIGDGYAAAGLWGVQFIHPEAQSDDQLLVIRGWTNPLSAEDAFVQDHPGVQLQRDNIARFTGETVREALAAGDTADLFYVKMDAAVAQMMQDGTLAPLSQSAILSADISGMLPQVQAAAAPGGTVYAVPDSLQIPLWLIRNNADTEPPQTLIALIRQDIAWSQASPAGALYLANDYNAVPWTARDYARYAVQQAFDESAADGQIPDFSADRFTEFLEALKNAALSDATYPTENTVITANSFFMPRGRAADDGFLHRRIISPPAVTADETQSIPAWLCVYVLNPNSSNKQLAMDFLEYAAHNRNVGNQALLRPASAGPSLYAYAWEPGFESLQALPDSWEVSEDMLALYRADIAPKIAVSLSPYTPNQSEMADTVMRYVDGEIALSQCTALLNALAGGESVQ